MWKSIVIALTVMQYMGGLIAEGETQPDCKCPVDEATVVDFEAELREMRLSTNVYFVEWEKSAIYCETLLTIFETTIENYIKNLKNIFKEELVILKEQIVPVQERQETLRRRLQLDIGLLDNLRRNITIEAKSVSIIHAVNRTRLAFSKNCLEKNGVHEVQVPTHNVPFAVPCDYTIRNGSWVVIQRRETGFVDFYRNWTEYKYGFGDMNAEFWLGLEKIHALTTYEPYELLILMGDFDDKGAYASYDAFAIGSESHGYYLKILGHYTGTAGDSLRQHKNIMFSTYDVDNANVKDPESNRSCSSLYGGAWWYLYTVNSNLNGQYLFGNLSECQIGKGVGWGTYRQNYSLKFVEMMIRPIRKRNIHLFY